MSDYIIPEDTGDIEQALKLKPTDKAHADLFNQITQTLLNNDNFLKKMANLIYQQAISYTDTKVSNLINGAPETLDTLKEVADAIQANETVVDALNSAIGTKAGKAEFDSHEANGNIHITSSEKQAIRDNTAQNVSFAHSLAQLNTDLAGKASSVHNHDDRYYTAGAVDNALATLWGDSKITVGSTTANMNPSEFSGVAASWSKIGKLVILRYACERTKSGVSITFVVSGIPPATNREEILWYNEAKGARGYLEGGNISLYAYGSTTGGYFRGETVYISQY